MCISNAKPAILTTCMLVTGLSLSAASLHAASLLNTRLAAETVGDIRQRPIGAGLPCPAIPNDSPCARLNVSSAGEDNNRSAVHRIDMRVSLLHAGDEAAKVELVLGRPTATAILEQEDENRLLVYADEPVRAKVRLTGGHVSAAILELVHIDTRLLPARARTVKPGMLRSGVLLLLGEPNREAHWQASGIEIERMVYTRPDESDLSVFLVSGVVADVRASGEEPLDILGVTLPPAVPDTAVGTNLSIGLNPQQAASLLGPLVWDQTHSTFKGQSVLYATYHERNGDRFVSLTFTGDVLTAFDFWSPVGVLSGGDICCSSQR
jgi:hypothetical protein